MHLIKSSKTLLLLSTFLSFNLYAQSSIFDENIISEDRMQNFKLNEKQIKENSNKLKKDWINPISYQYAKNLGTDYKTEKSVIAINQPIFQSGGIYEAINYADSTYDYANKEIVQQKRALIKTAITYLFSIKKVDVNIKKAKLSIQNAKIDVTRKKEQVLNGFLDSSFLDNALLTLNSSKHTLIDLKYQKKELINNFQNISSKDYKSFVLPKLKLSNQKDFIENNIEVSKLDADIKMKKNFSYMTITKYLPSVNAYYNYSKYHYTDGKSSIDKNSDQTFGLTLNVPLDTRTFNDIESKKIDYLKSKLSLKNKIQDEKTFFQTKLDKIALLDERITITKEDLKLYDSILAILKEEKEAQLKTQNDLDTLQNSQNIKSLDLILYELDKQIELLELYARVY